MKTMMILWALALSVPALSEDKNYQYKDLSPDAARPYVKEKAPPAREPGSEKREQRRPAKTIEETIEESRKRNKQ